MIQTFVQRWEENKGTVRETFAKEHPASYGVIVKAVIEAVTSAERDYDGMSPDPERIHCIDDGDYQGTLLFVIAEKGYQPSDYYFVKVYYGSCSGCDTLQAIESEGGYGEKPTENQIDQYMTLALHIVQGLKVMRGGEAE